jgi:hypothetical protein
VNAAKVMVGLRLPRRPLVAAVLVAAGLSGACREKLDGGANCAVAQALCPGQAVEIRDTIIDPTLAFDSTYEGFPSRGAESRIPIIARGTELETVAIIRFDTLVTSFLPPGDTVQAIRYVDSSYVKLRLDVTRAELPDSIRVDVYDVGDSTVTDDTASAPVLSRFDPRYLIGSRVVAKVSFVDSILVPLSDSAVLARLADSTLGPPRLRIGVRASGAGNISFRIGTTDAGDAAELRYRPRNDTAVHQVVSTPMSAGPAGRIDIRLDLKDYGLTLRNTLATPTGTMTVGGVPGQRVYLRFTLPRRLTDSTTVIRATLHLNQVPVAGFGTADTVVVYPHIVLAGPLVTDNRRAATLIAAKGLIVTDSLVTTPGASGLRELELYGLVRAWGAQGTGDNVPPRARVLTARDEGAGPWQAAFSSSTAAAGLRPRMRITYIPKVTFGMPQ